MYFSYLMSGVKKIVKNKTLQDFWILLKLLQKSSNFAKFVFILTSQFAWLNEENLP